MSEPDDVHCRAPFVALGLGGRQTLFKAMRLGGDA
jgi:hypothetical protein